jgi:uncharacterized membrane protein YfcA
MGIFELVFLGLIAGTAAGILAGLLGIGGGTIIVPVVYYGLLQNGVAANQAAHIAVATSLAAIFPAAIASFQGHWRAGNADFTFLRDWGPGIALGVVVAQFMAPHVRGAVLSGLFGLFCLIFAVRFAAPDYFRPFLKHPPGGTFRVLSGVGIGAVSGFAGISGGILTNIVMTVSGLPMHKSIGRSAAAGVEGRGTSGTRSIACNREAEDGDPRKGSGTRHNQQVRAAIGLADPGTALGRPPCQSRSGA